MCPDENEKQTFIKSYLENYLGREPTKEEVNDILTEIPIFEAASHAFWIFWALYQGGNSDIDFDYIDYAFKRFGEYSKIVTQIKSSQ